ncbi:MarR family winged helix-turn-helix transcriptional regulator [Peterkaempfera sp. SMS 1(5)a]|uniref:MarR family winged helix-turn-helix transcriptional regulator n=1 Tax=Peterkaempfera podocarpi TaxID=3232308 RepID=UPI00366FBAFA
MNDKPSVETASARQRRRLGVEIKDSLRELSNQLSLLNHQVGGQLGLKDVDFDCLDVIVRHGPLNPSALARRAGLHPATVTGILDRLQRGGWVVRERDPEAADRRAVTVRALPDRQAEVYGLFRGMNSAMDELCDSYSEDELRLLARFLKGTAQAGRTATDELAGD